MDIRMTIGFFGIFALGIILTLLVPEEEFLLREIIIGVPTMLSLILGIISAIIYVVKSYQKRR